MEIKTDNFGIPSGTNKCLPYSKDITSLSTAGNPREPCSWGRKDNIPLSPAYVGQISLQLK